MPIVQSHAPTPIYVPTLGRILLPETDYTVSDAEAAELRNHPWITAITAVTPIPEMSRSNEPNESEK